MGITSSNKILSATKIDCNGNFKVKFSLTAAPDIASNPKDIILALDESGSMTGTPLTELKRSAKRFVDIIDESTDGNKDGIIGNGSHIGVVSFSTTANILLPLTDDANQINASIDSLTTKGLTNHYDAFSKAYDSFDMTSSNEKIIVLFTDGHSTSGSDASLMTNIIKQKGITIYCIGLNVSPKTPKVLEALQDWTTDPDSTHLILAPTPQDLDDAFNELASNITTPGATNILIKDTINPCFKIASFDVPKIGTVKLIDKHNIQWSIPKLGANVSESASFEFDVTHVGPCSGLVNVSDYTSYMDNEENVVNFPNPNINVVCGIETNAQKLPIADDISIDGCEEYLSFDASDLELDSLGRILDVNVKIKNVCPNRKVALAAYLTELDVDGVEYDRGIKIMTIPAHNNPTCQDMIVRCIKFVLPENSDLSGLTGSLCDNREFRVRFLAHYIDSNAKYDCPDAT